MAPGKNDARISTSNGSRRRTEEGARIVLSNYEKCVLKELQKTEQDQVDQQDLVLKCQVEVKTHVNICKEQKKALNDDFNAFCEAKYHAPVGEVESSEGMPLVS